MTAPDIYKRLLSESGWTRLEDGQDVGGRVSWTYKSQNQKNLPVSRLVLILEIK